MNNNSDRKKRDTVVDDLRRHLSLSQEAERVQEERRESARVLEKAAERGDLATVRKMVAERPCFDGELAQVCHEMVSKHWWNVVEIMIERWPVVFGWESPDPDDLLACQVELAAGLGDVRSLEGLLDRAGKPPSDASLMGTVIAAGTSNIDREGKAALLRERFGSAVEKPWDTLLEEISE